MSDVEKIRVVPNGKIYRQMFEAQALLHHQLVQPKPQSAGVVSKGLPVIHTSREASTQGLLDSRQKSWLNGLPFDVYTENPVLNKQYAKFVQAKRNRCKSPVEKSIVQALPEHIEPKPHSTSIVEKIENSRRLRHEALLEELSHELTIIASQLENIIEEASQMLYTQLDMDDKEINELISAIELDESLLQFTYQRLENLWYQIQEHLPKRQKFIEELDEKFTKLEALRSVQVKNLLIKYFGEFEKIAYKSKNEIQRMMDNIAQMINQTILSNKINYTDIFVKSIMSEIEREKKQHYFWLSRLDYWKNVNLHRFLDQLRDYVNSKEVIYPPIIDELMEKMVHEHTCLNNQYKQLLNALRDLYPPKCLPKLLEQWFEQTHVISRAMYEVAGMYVLELERAQSENSKTCLDKIEETKMLLVMNHFCSSEIATKLTNEFIPTIEIREDNFMADLNDLKMDIDFEFTHSNELIKNIFMFLQSVTKLWQTHETGLGKQEERLHESMQEHRLWHNEQNQKREDKLDSILDEMRQGANETILNSLINQTKIILTNIQISYQEFYTDQVKIVKTYPDMVVKQLQFYKENICKYFKLNEVEMEEETASPTDETTTYSAPFAESISPVSYNQSEDPNAQCESAADTKRQTDSKSESSSKVTSDEAAGRSEHVEKVQEKSPSASLKQSSSSRDSEPRPVYLVTEIGTRYQCLSQSDTQEIKEESSLGDSKENVQHLYLSENFVRSIKLQIRLNFLNHFDTWVVTAKQNSEHATQAKIEELDAEFNLRVQLHFPRGKRIEQDVYNVRAGELLLHSSRVNEHCQGVEKALMELKCKFFTVKQNQEKMMGEFQNQIELMEPAFLNITKSARLITLRNQMSKEIQKLMVGIRKNLRVFRVQLDQDLQTVRDSNASLVQNFKLFSDGGNFCPDEISQFQKTIEELSSMIDDNECHILVEMEGMEASRFDQASRITIEFEDRFKNHIFDLLFVETIAKSLTNTQVQIKTQVAKNNSCSKDISNFISTMKHQIESCEHPNPDLNKFDSSQIHKTFINYIDVINTRAKYLKCFKTAEDAVAAAPSQAVFTTEIPSVSKPGKVMLEDSSVGMIKSILRSQKIPVIEVTPEPSSTEGEDADTSPNSNAESGTESSPTKKAKKAKSKKAVQKSSSRFYKRHITINHSTKTVRLKLYFGESEDKETEEDKEPDEECNDFLGIIKNLVQSIFIQIGAIAEDFYRQKGSRQITRPQLMQDTYENCAEALGDKLVSYYNQAKEYIQRCHIEFYGQVEELENLSKRIPPLLFRSLLEKHLQNLDNEFSKWENMFQKTIQTLEQEQKRNSCLLQPNLGHPQKAAQLHKLNENEMNRHEQFTMTLEKYFLDLQKCSIKCSESFLQDLVKLNEKLLLQFDDMLTSLEIGKNDSLMKIKPDFRSEAKKDTILTGVGGDKKRGSWPGISLVEIYTKTSLKCPFVRRTSATVTTNKSSLPQQSTLQSRNDAYQIYLGIFERRVVANEKRKKKLLQEEQTWFENWTRSVENIRELFV